MKRVAYFWILIIFLILGFIAQPLSVYAAEPGKNNKTVQPVPPKNLTNVSVLDYYKEMRSAINAMADIVYSSYGFWEEEKKITVSFDLSQNGKLDERSISFPKKSTADKALCNLTILTLKKTFATHKLPFPKELLSNEKMRFAVTLLFKKYEREEPANPSPAGIGIVAGDINDDLRAIYGLNSREGIFVVKVIDNRPAKIAGIKNYDAIYATNDKPIKTTQEFAEFLEKNQGDITLTTNRGNFLIKR